MARPGFVRSLGTIFLGVLTYIVIQSTIDAAPPCSFVSTIGVCDLQRNVSEVALSRQNEIIKYINSTILGITMVTTKTECVEALQRVFCRKHFTSCSKTNNTSEQRQQECEAVEGNCSELLAKTYANTTCPSISAYTGNLCVGLNVTKDSYCPAGEVYKILAKDVSTFLEQAGQGKKGFIRLLGNDLESCRKIYRRVHCKSFAQSCSTYNKMTKEKCEQDLACLNSNSTVNKTELCSKFPNEKLLTTDSPTTIHHQNSHSPSKSPPSGLATTAVTTPSLANTTKTMVTFKLGNTKYIGSYENKTSPSYILLSKDVTNALNKAYAGLTGFVAVEILGLTCHNEVFVKHNIITRQSEVKPGMEIIKDKLTTANTAGFLKDKIIIPTIKETCETEAKHKHDENNWVYMIIFVCVTALLLLAMVLCNQST